MRMSSTAHVFYGLRVEKNLLQFTNKLEILQGKLSLPLAPLYNGPNP
jgi:hypothetical protein